MRENCAITPVTSSHTQLQNLPQDQKREKESSKRGWGTCAQVQHSEPSSTLLSGRDARLLVHGLLRVSW